MNKIEKQLLEERKRLQSIQAPTSLERTLENRLNQEAPKKQRKTLKWAIVAVAMILLMTISYNYNALAYYSKKILGFDENLFGTLKKLNENEMGQPIDQSVELENGTIFTVNGIMTDENQTVLFYTLSNPDGLDEEGHDSVWISSITGFMTNSNPIGGSGTYNEDMTELKNIHYFEAVNPFAKNLTINFSDEPFSDWTEQRKITFKHDPNKAMRASLKLSLNEKLTFDLGLITIKSITASPTVTIVEGTLKMDNADQFEYPDNFPYIQLIANGNTLRSEGSGMTTGATGTKIELRYNALPEDLESLQINLKHFIGYEEINRKIDLQPDLEEKISLFDEKEVLIKEIEETERGLEMRVVTDPEVKLDEVAIETSSGIIPPHSKLKEENMYMNEYFYLFDTQETPEFFIVDGIYYIKTYDQTIDIPID